MFGHTPKRQLSEAEARVDAAINWHRPKWYDDWENILAFFLPLLAFGAVLFAGGFFGRRAGVAMVTALGGFWAAFMLLDVAKRQDGTYNPYWFSFWVAVLVAVASLMGTGFWHM